MSIRWNRRWAETDFEFCETSDFSVKVRRDLSAIGFLEQWLNYLRQKLSEEKRKVKCDHGRTETVKLILPPLSEDTYQYVVGPPRPYKEILLGR
ncbi:MAG: hypothetical protein JRD89_04385 [Deltaproteobacteria bacterium]|nr:hypothetical protein [Deltaproteobacteria bacterium]